MVEAGDVELLGSTGSQMEDQSKNYWLLACFEGWGEALVGFRS